MLALQQHFYEFIYRDLIDSVLTVEAIAYHISKLTQVLLHFSKTD